MGFSFKNILPAVGAAIGLPFVGATALSLGGSALDYFSAQEQNKSAESQARASMDFSSAQAARQMDFQERMSSTAHQRQVADLRAAGLNPLLSANSGADSPGGSSGSGAQAPVVPQFSGIASSARDTIGLYSQFKQAQASSDLAKASAAKVGVETDLLRKKGPEADLDKRFYDFINGLMDRFGRSSAKPSSPKKSDFRPWTKEDYKEFPGAGLGSRAIDWFKRKFK